MTTTASPKQHTEPKRKKNVFQSAIAITIQTLITLAIIAGGLFAAQYLFMTAPKADKKAREVKPVLVQTHAVNTTNFTVQIEAFGSVEAARSVNIQPQVSGIITHINQDLVPGGRIAKGSVICTIDPADYQITIKQRQADLIKSKNELAIEQGRRNVAQREYNLLNKSASPEDLKLILREPQLQTVEANILTAQSALESAQLNLDRTTIQMPFNAIVRTKNADLGTLASQSTNIASVVGTDEFWVRLLIPTRDLKWFINSDITDPQINIFNDFAWNGQSRDASLMHLVTDLDDGARMAQVLINVNDPLTIKSENANKPQLLIGMYVRANIQGSTLHDVFAIPNNSVHDNNTIWVLKPDSTLDIRTITPIWQDKNTTVFKNVLNNGEKLIVSQIITPIQDMKLQPAK
ncbi:efflux RND transporter periplasmic adaptor subunit [Planctomycetota bacterium]|nr:efflux RND transporter periplasmic adaptor subunit [Planctomycetota bacterium]